MLAAMLGSIFAPVTASMFVPAKSPTDRSVALVLAPSNLGLRPNEDGTEPGTWQAPAVLMEAGLARRLSPAETSSLPRPAYRRDAEPGTRIRNGSAIRSFSINLAARISAVLSAGRFPVVIGGDCSILLGCLLGARQGGRLGLVHVDGHSDFFHPGNYDAKARLGTAAGMDLALATGRGEALLTRWPGVDGPLVSDEDTTQLGERDALSPDFDRYYGDVRKTRINRMIIQDVLRDGIGASIGQISSWLEERQLDRAWLHVDLDVLDEGVMPAVDSPGSPGLSFDHLAELVSDLKRTGKIAGVAFAIYDPDRDPKRRYAPLIVDCIGRGLVD